MSIHQSIEEKFTTTECESQEALRELSPGGPSSLSAPDNVALAAALAVVWDTARAKAASHLDITSARSGTCPPSLLDTCHQVGRNATSVYQNDYARVVAHDTFRLELVKSLAACGRAKEADAVGSCGSQFTAYECTDCGAFPAVPSSCKHRLEPDCNARRASLFVSEHESLLKELRYPKMLTLTFRSVPHINRAYLRYMRQCFTQLRHRKIFASCWGGLYSFEFDYITVGWHTTRDGKRYYASVAGWHPHIHAVIGSRFIDRDALSKEWEKITGAWDVDIRAIKGDDKWAAIEEVIKYPSKAVSFVHDADLVDEFLKATDGVSLAYGFGAMYRVKTKPHHDGKLKCPMCGSSNLKKIGLVGKQYCHAVNDDKGKRLGYVWKYVCPGAPRAPPGEREVSDA